MNTLTSDTILSKSRLFDQIRTKNGPFWPKKSGSGPWPEFQTKVGGLKKMSDLR